jgi:hypothetical protein
MLKPPVEVIFQKKRRRRAGPTISRSALYLRQGGRCYWCGRICLTPAQKQEDSELMFTRDHIKPYFTGPPEEPPLSANIVGACQGCNSRRSVMQNYAPNYSFLGHKPPPEALRFARMTGVDRLRGKPRPLGRGQERGRRSRLMRRLLLLNILADNCNWRTAAATGKVGRRPQCATPKIFTDTWVILFSNHSTGNSF